ALKLEDSKAEIRCWGGDYMEKEGGELVVHYREVAFMGFLEVIKNIRVLWKFINLCKKDLIEYNPDVLILIDFAGFNMRMAKFAKANNIRVFYYISPKVWAWNQSRALKIKKVVDKMFVILPFEKEFYKKYDYKVDYVGNPLLDAIREFEENANFLKENNLGEKPIVAVLPGSRHQEVQNIMPVMLQIANHFPDFDFVVAAVKSLPESLYGIDPNKNTRFKMVFDKTYDLLKNAHAAVVTSGTATLETALFNIPQVVCYKTSRISYHIASYLIKVPYISLVNLIAEKELVKELIQDDLNPEQLSLELKQIITGKRREKQIKGYQEIHSKLGTTKASENLAKLIVKYLK
ncbi:MAG: lipid-A-disaccharide synthase, partial [Bacteroidota bacterium]|nr:lipid-A-disaccharide synthase [Bacteroidota bacterium]MDQ3536713.1 lipid-A-disaccharide synthase [Bacteroidota bacterium]